jgi:hypothetical protein
LATFWNDLKNSLVAGISIVSAAITSTTTGSAVDLGEGDGGSCGVFHCATITDGTHTISFTESDTSGGSYTAVAKSDTKVIAAADSTSVVVVNFVRTKRFVKAVSTVGSATTGGVYGAALYTMKKSG